MGSKGYMKYHIKEFCYSECKFLDYHQNLKENDANILNAFVKQVQGEYFSRKGPTMSFKPNYFMI